MRLRVRALAEVVGRRVVRGDVIFGVVGIIIIIITITVVVVAFVAVAVALVVAAATAAFAECRTRGQEIRVYVADVARRTRMGAEFGDEEERRGGNVLLHPQSQRGGIRSASHVIEQVLFCFVSRETKARKREVRCVDRGQAYAELVG